MHVETLMDGAIFGALITTLVALAAVALFSLAGRLEEWVDRE